MRRIVIVHHAAPCGSERRPPAPTRSPGTAIGSLGVPATSAVRADTVVAS